MAPHAEYKAASDVVGDNNGNWIDLRYESGAGLNDRSRLISLAFSHLPQVRCDFGIRFLLFTAPLNVRRLQIAFTVRAARDPARLPGALTELNLVQNAARSFAFSMYEVVAKLYQLQWHFSTIRDVYEAGNIVDVVPDGTLTVPTGGPAYFTTGVALEFRWVKGSLGFYHATDRIVGMCRLNTLTQTNTPFATYLLAYSLASFA